MTIHIHLCHRTQGGQLENQGATGTTLCWQGGHWSPSAGGHGCLHAANGVLADQLWAAEAGDLSDTRVQGQRLQDFLGEAA